MLVFHPRQGVLLLLLLHASCVAPDPNPFTAGDWDGDGRLSAEELEGAVIDTVFEFSDADLDGRITFAEWVAVNPDADGERFARSDVNRDGALSRQEVYEAADHIGLRAKLLGAADTNGDGWVDIDEASAFRHLLMHSEGSTEMSKVANWIHG